MLKNRLVLLFVCLNLAITLPLAATLNVWIDEAYTLDTTGSGLIHAWIEAIQFENQPPLYFAFLALWRKLNDSIFFARFFSCLCIAATVLCGPLLSKRYLPDLHPRWLTLAIALNPYSIWAALEIRTYALGILLSALLLLLFCDGYLVDRPNRWARYGYVPLAIVALYTNYFLGALLLAQMLTLALIRRHESLPHFQALVLVGLAFVPMLWPLANQVLSQSSAFGEHQISLIGTVRSVLGRVLLFAIPSELDWGWSSAWDGIRYGALGLALGLGLKKKSAWREESVALLTLFVGALVPLVVVLDITDHARVVERYGYPLFLPTLLLALALLSLLRQHQRQVLMVNAIACGLCVLSLCSTYAPLAKEGGDWRRMAAYLEAHEMANQPIVIFSAEGARPLKYHYRGVNALVPLPAVSPDSGYNLHNLVLQGEDDITSVLSSVLSHVDSRSTPVQSEPVRPEPVESGTVESGTVGADATQLPGEFWLIEAPLHMVVDQGEIIASTGLVGVGKRCEIWNIDLNCQILDQFVALNYDVVERVGFYDAQLKRLRQKPLLLTKDAEAASSVENQGS